MNELTGPALNTVLLALRYMQANYTDAVDSVTEGGANSYGELLDDDGIDELCEQLNERMDTVDTLDAVRTVLTAAGGSHAAA